MPPVLYYFLSQSIRILIPWHFQGWWKFFRFFPRNQIPLQVEEFFLPQHLVEVRATLLIFRGRALDHLLQFWFLLMLLLAEQFLYYHWFISNKTTCLTSGFYLIPAFDFRSLHLVIPLLDGQLLNLLFLWWTKEFIFIYIYNDLVPSSIIMGWGDCFFAMFIIFSFNLSSFSWLC